MTEESSAWAGTHEGLRRDPGRAKLEIPRLERKFQARTSATKT